MKENFILLTIFSYALFSAQQGKVGINTSNPDATLDVVSKANTGKALRISNTTPNEIVTVLNNGQVGINQATPENDALLELKSTNKSLLLTRVANTAAIATPINGMLIYDLTQNCIKAYENNTWSGCLSANGNTTPPPTYGAERTPCSGLADVRDFSFSNDATRKYGYPMFVSGDGYIYGGWEADYSAVSGFGNTFTGDGSTTYAYAGDLVYSAFPLANILKYLPTVKWKRILGTGGSYETYMFGITETGKLYNWGSRINSPAKPISGVLTTFTNRTGAEVPREIVNPDGNEWKEIYDFETEFVYAVDHTGKWWSWGGLTTSNYNPVSFAKSPIATQYYYTSPQAAAALVPAPKYDPNIEETFAMFRGNSALSIVYIGTDNKVYTFGENVGVYNGTAITSPQLITLPAGVNPVKVLSGWTLNNFLILGDNGIVYRVGNGGGYIPATGFTAVALTTNAYNFKDLVIGITGDTIHAVPKNGDNMVRLGYGWSTGVGFTGPSITTVVTGTSRFNIVKLWSDKYDNVILKDGNSGNVYLYNLNSSILTGTNWPPKAIGFQIYNYTPNNNTDPNGDNLYRYGPFKLINCQQ